VPKRERYNRRSELGFGFEQAHKRLVRDKEVDAKEQLYLPSVQVFLAIVINKRVPPTTPITYGGLNRRNLKHETPNPRD